MTKRERRQLDLASLKLEQGSHNPDHTFCVMEAAAYMAGEKWSDHPTCVSPMIATFLRNWNDSVDDDFRQRLKPYIERVLDTRTTTKDETRRAWLLTDWLVRVQAPAWLDLAGLRERATELRNLQPLTSHQIAVAVQSVIDGARKDAAAAWAAAWDAAGAAARDAAGAAAGAAERAAMRAAMRAAARAAAWAAAWAAERDAAGDAAGDAAWAAAWAAAWDAAGAAERDAAGDAAWDAASKRLAPTVAQLQESAFDLLDRLIAVGKMEPAL